MVAPNVGYLFFVNSSLLISHGPLVQSTLFWNKSGNLTDNETYMAYNFNFRNRAIGTAWIATNYVQLLAPFDPTNTGREKLAAGTKHYWNSFGTEFTSSPRNRLTYSFATRYGGFYADGTRLNLRTTLGYRFQPYVATKFSVDYNIIKVPYLQKPVELLLLGPRVDVTFRNNLFWTTFVQYNNQANNVNLNTRLQWRYQPASDLFIVYTDNYLPENLMVKNRALVLKMTYWWNI